MPLSDEEVRNLGYEKHQRYRAGAAGIMSTVVAVSSGAIVGLHQIGAAPRASTIAFSVPIALAILQQLCHYLGQQFEAKALSTSIHLTDMSNISAPKDEAPLERNKRLIAVNKQVWPLHVWTWRFYNAASGLCVGAVLALLACGAWAIYTIPAIPPAPSAAAPQKP